MTKQTDENVFDVRVLEHRLRRGEITREEYDKHLAKLPDDADEGAETETRFGTPYWDRHYDPDAVAAAEQAADES